MTYNRVQVDDFGHIFWNDQRISSSDLSSLMDDAGKLLPTPQIILQSSPKARCVKIIEVRSLMDSAPICRKSHLCGEGFGWKNRADVILGGGLDGEPEL